MAEATPNLNELLEQIQAPGQTPVEVLEAYQAHPDVTSPSERLRCPDCDSPIPPNVPTQEGVDYTCSHCGHISTGREMLDQAIALTAAETVAEPERPGHG